jgi:arabinan endo-1,5-alpha-L-arabinosidase
MIKRISHMVRLLIALPLIFVAGCSDDPPGDQRVVNPPPPPPPPEEVPFDIEKLTDTYAALTSFDKHMQWGPYNVHDPSILNDDEYFYCYSTDAGYGIDVRPGVQIRRSKDLVDWRFVGWVFNGLPKQGSDFIKQNGGEPFNSLWAPYMLKAGNEYRLYYSLSSAKPRLSVIGLATSSSPTGPWTEKGLAVTSLDNTSIQTNAIDPTVIIDQTGQHWMYYGSAWDGIYKLKLDAATGLAAVNNDKGMRVAQRGFTGDQINGNIEGPDIIYNPAIEKYYLFISYDWLDTKYNVRVGRSDSPEGPFYDMNGKDMNVAEDNHPMIIAPYKFKEHGGWQGTSHPSIFADDDGRYFIAHQGRPGVDRYFMVLHVREVFWTDDGWPVVSPERFAGIEQTDVPASEIPGEWERIRFGYNVVPGYAEEQVTPDFQLAVPITLDESGTIDGDAGSTWNYEAPWLELAWSSGSTDRVMVKRGRDWENKKTGLVFTGYNEEGTSIWGKK